VQMREKEVKLVENIKLPIVPCWQSKPNDLLTRNTTGVISAIQLSEQGLGSCQFINLWHLENTNCVTRKHNWAIELH
jgi:hypothetical protein